MDKSGSVQVDYGYKATLVQVIMCIIANTAILSSGMTLGFTAIALPYMQEPNNVLYVNANEASWIASVAAIITPLGCLASGPIIDSFGRKMGLLLLNIPAFIGWLIIAVKPSLLCMYIGRLFTGFACGVSSTPATVFVAESSTPSLRGYLVTGTSISISMGVATVYIMGLIWRENWQLVAIICSIFPVISTLAILFIMPESPAWLIRQKKLKKAEESLKLLRGNASYEVVKNEFDELKDKLINDDSNSKKSNFMAIIKSFSRPQAYKPFILMNLFFFFQQASGIFVVIFYAVDVVKEAGVKSDPFVVAVLIGLTRLVTTFFAAWMSKRFGRRITAIVSGIGMTISLMVLSTHILLEQMVIDGITTFEHPLEDMNYTDSKFNPVINMSADATTDDIEESISLLPVTSILIYILASTVGFLTLPWAMLGELFPVNIRGFASGATSCIAYVISFVVVKLYPKMLEVFHKHGVFYFYGTMSLIGTLFVFFFLPETQGKSLAEIEKEFCNKKNRRTDFDEEENLHRNTKMVTIKNFTNQRESLMNK